MSRPRPKARITDASCAIGLVWADPLARRGYDPVLLAILAVRPGALARFLRSRNFHNALLFRHRQRRSRYSLPEESLIKNERLTLVFDCYRATFPKLIFRSRSPQSHWSGRHTSKTERKCHG